MNFEPQKFFIGLVDFFSIFLPGALLVYIIGPDAWEKIFDKTRELPRGAELWVVVLFASYLLGQILFLISSWLDEFYDWTRQFTRDKQIKRIVRRGRLMGWWFRVPLWLLYKRERNVAVDRAGRIKKAHLSNLQAVDAINTFQWSKARLAIEHPDSLAVVHRFEADSKFFRSLVIVMFLFVIWYSTSGHADLALCSTALMILALWRYMEQRHKATNQAYWSVITLTAKDGKIDPDKPKPIPAPTHAGGVVFKTRWWGEPRYLLVEAKDDPKQWVLPKGHVEEGEEHRETAVREVFEETGVWARIVHDLGDVAWPVDGSVVTTRFFLMRAVGRGLRKDKERRHEWLALKKAVARGSYTETRNLLETAEQQRMRT